MATATTTRPGKFKLPVHSSPALYKLFAPASEMSGTRSPMPYPNPAVGNWAVGLITEWLGVTPYKLGILLGCSTPNVVYTWKSGIKTPSAFFMARILKLVEMQHAGVDFSEVKRMEWNTVTPIYANGQYAE